LIDGPMVFVAALWILFIAGCIAVWADKRRDK